VLLLAACATTVADKKYRVVIDEKASAETVAAIMRHYEFERYTDAIRLAEAWKPTQLPEEINVLVALARVKTIDDAARFEAALQQVESKYVASLLVKFEVGIQLKKQDRKRLALSYLKDVATGEATTLMERRARAYAMAELGKYERGFATEARAALADLIAGGDASALTYYYDALVAYEAKLLRLAIRSLRQALEVNPWQFDSLLALGVALDESGQHSEAVKELKAAVEKYPLKSELHMRLGAAHLSLRQWQEAEDALLIAVELSPRAALPVANLAEAHMRLNRRESAMSLAQRAVKNNRDEPYAWVVLAALAHETGQTRIKRDALANLKILSADAAKLLAARQYDLRAYLKNP
jgi:tetratricopeptide (TPR) repeat protein